MIAWLRPSVWLDLWSWALGSASDMLDHAAGELRRTGA